MKYFAIFTLLVLAQSSLAYEFWDDLRVTWSPIPMVGYEHLPRNAIDALKRGWVLDSASCTNEGRFSGNRYLFPDDMGVAVLLDSQGNAAGVQTLIPQSETLVNGAVYRFDLVPMIQNETIMNVDYFVITTYFVSPENICNATVGKPNIGLDSQVYFQNGPNIQDLKIAPKNRTEAIATGWTKNQCIPGMGWHNFFEVEKYQENNCEQYQPTCLLFDDFGRMHGFCLIMGGNVTSPRYEHPSSAGIIASLGPDVTPACLLEQTDLIGATTIHFYFTNTPWNYLCPPPANSTSN